MKSIGSRYEKQITAFMTQLFKGTIWKLLTSHTQPQRQRSAGKEYNYFGPILIPQLKQNVISVLQKSVSCKNKKQKNKNKNKKNKQTNDSCKPETWRLHEDWLNGIKGFWLSLALN